MLPSDKYNTGLADNRGSEFGLLPESELRIQRQAQTGGEWNNRLVWTLAELVAGCRIRVCSVDHGGAG